MRNSIKYIPLLFPFALYQSLIIGSSEFLYTFLVITLLSALYLFLHKKYRFKFLIKPIWPFLIISIPLIGLFFLIRIQSKNDFIAGEVITHHLDAYNLKYNHYPNNLSELSPEFRKSIPKIWKGIIPLSYEYKTDPEFGYYLRMKNGGGEGYCIWYRGMGWDCVE